MIVAQFVDGGHWCVQHRLYTADGNVVEPIVTIPLDVWLRHDEVHRAQLVEAGVAFSVLLYPELTEELPDGERGIDGEPGTRASGAGSGDSDAPDDAPAGGARRPGR